MVSSEGRRYCFPICLAFRSGLTRKLRGICAVNLTAVVMINFSLPRNKMATSENLWILPLWATSPSMRPLLTGLSTSLPNLASWLAVVVLNCANFFGFLSLWEMRRFEKGETNVDLWVLFYFSPCLILRSLWGKKFSRLTSLFMVIWPRIVPATQVFLGDLPF